MKSNLLSSKGKHTKNNKLHSLGRKVNTLVAVLLVASITIVVLICVTMLRSQCRKMLQDRCVNGTNMLAYQLEHYNPEDKNQLLDDLKEQMRCEFTIFDGNIRAFTTNMRNGERVVGTELSEELADRILEHGESYVGVAAIVDEEHLCSYVPTRDENGKVDGLICASISMTDVSEQINRTVIISIIAGVALTLLAILLMTVYTTIVISRPLSRLTKLAQTMEKGNLGLESHETLTANVHSRDEIGLLAHIFEDTINRLKAYIGEISTILESVSEGNLALETQQDYIGDFSSIKVSLDNILNRLNDTMSQISESSIYVSNGSNQMSMGAQALSQGAVEQSSAVEELEGTIQDISQQVTHTAGNAQLASEKVDTVNTQLQESNQKMQEMILAMEEINQRSNEIGNIIKTIENIALQTNILALNSAVEAARAGEAGKGFAVVAKEVQTLAGRSSQASKTTAELIQHSITAVKRGTKIAHETAEQLASVVTGTMEVVDATNLIANAAKSQAESVSLVENQITQISTVVQTNSATAEESAATSQELDSQASILKNLIDMFQLRK